MGSQWNWLVEGRVAGVTSQDRAQETVKPKKKMSSPSARLKGVSNYNDSKAGDPVVSKEVIEIGLSFVAAVIVVMGVLGLLKRIRR